MSIILASCGAGQTSGSSAIPEDKAVENKVESVLKKMTIEEKPVRWYSSQPGHSARTIWSIRRK